MAYSLQSRCSKWQKKAKYQKYITDAIWFQLKSLKAIQQGCFYQLKVEIKKRIGRLMKKLFHRQISAHRRNQIVRLDVNEKIVKREKGESLILLYLRKN